MNVPGVAVLTEIRFGPNIKKDYILLLGITFCNNSIILCGSTTRKHHSCGVVRRRMFYGFLELI